jgi:hypothetical protein
MELVELQKMTLLIKATEIATQAAASGTMTAEGLAEVIEKTYKKMLQLAKEN